MFPIHWFICGGPPQLRWINMSAAHFRIKTRHGCFIWMYLRREPTSSSNRTPVITCMLSTDVIVTFLKTRKLIVCKNAVWQSQSHHKAHSCATVVVQTEGHVKCSALWAEYCTFWENTRDVTIINIVYMYYQYRGVAIAKLFTWWYETIDFPGKKFSF